MPGNNLWWFRTAFDYAIGYATFESLRPGFLTRTRRCVERENNQTFWMRPLGVRSKGLPGAPTQGAKKAGATRPSLLLLRYFIAAQRPALPCRQ